MTEALRAADLFDEYRKTGDYPTKGGERLEVFHRQDDPRLSHDRECRGPAPLRFTEIGPLLCGHG